MGTPTAQGTSRQPGAGAERPPDLQMPIPASNRFRCILRHGGAETLATAAQACVVTGTADKFVIGADDRARSVLP